ncbi:hypothetical protein R6Q59_027192 [Mikania micrantha]
MAGLKRSQHLELVLKDIQEATKYFEIPIGSGGFGEMEYDTRKKEEEYWKKKLPDDSEEILERLNPPVREYSTSKELFMLLHKGFFFDNGDRAHAIFSSVCHSLTPSQPHALLLTPLCCSHRSVHLQSIRESSKVRSSACYSSRMPAIFSAELAEKVLGLLMDVLNDDSIVVRLGARETMHHLAVSGHLKVQEMHMHMVNFWLVIAYIVLILVL